MKGNVYRGNNKINKYIKKVRESVCVSLLRLAAD